MTNNRFRFRVWDKNGNSYISEEDDADFLYLGDNGKLTVGLYNGDEDDITYLKEEDLIIEQCTGLKDKKGRLIYEGDIVKRHSKYSEEEKDVILQVEWNCKGGRYITTDKKHDNWFFSMFEYEYEILGNIHENPELIQEA